MVIKAYGYCRYSSDMQTEMSIIQQKNELTEYANRNNIEIVDFYVDEAKSGTKDNRDNFQLMINDCKKKKVQAVLVWKTDRFARNTQDSLFYKFQLEKLGISLISITQPIDTNTPEGNLMYTLLAGIDEYYSKNLASNVRRAMKLNAQNGLSNGGRSPYGYKIIDQKYTIVEDEADIVRKIFDLYINGYSLDRISIELENNGIHNRNGKAFAETTLRQMLENERYTGTYIYKPKKNEDNIIKIPNSIPPIISYDTFTKAIERKEYTKSHYIKKEKNSYLFTGLIRCGICGSSYCGQTITETHKGQKVHYAFYRCQRKQNRFCKNLPLKQINFEEYMIKHIINNILNGKTIDNIADKIIVEYNKLTKNTDKVNLNLNKEIKSVDEKINNLVNVISMTGNAVLVTELEKLQKQKEKLEYKLETTNNINEIKITSSLIKEILEKDINKLSNGSKEELKLLVQRYVKQVLVYDTYITVEYTFKDIQDKIDLTYIENSSLLHYVENISRNYFQ